MESLLPILSDAMDIDFAELISPSKGDNSFSSDSDDSGLGMDFDQEEMSEEDVFRLSPLPAPVFDFDGLSDTDEDFQLRRPAKSGFGRFHSFDVQCSPFTTRRPLSDADMLINQDRPDAIIQDSSVADVESVKSAVNMFAESEDLTGDGRQTFCLPTIPGKHQDLKSISADTVADVVLGKFDDEIGSVTIVDCRYPYEFEGGHIENAVNLNTQQKIDEFLRQQSLATSDDVIAEKRNIVIFHCEFSSERGPKLCRYLRSQDRDLNKDRYPHLHFPEVYLLHNGYKAFYESQKELCTPMDYMPMLHQDHSEDLRHFRSKSKSWTAGEKRKRTMRLRF